MLPGGRRVPEPRVVRALKAKEYPVFIVQPQFADTRDQLYRVQVGPYSSREEAEVIRKMLAQEGFKPFIRR